MTSVLVASTDLVLAIDTASPIGSVAIARNGSVMARASLEHRAEHASRLMPTIGRVLDEAGVDRRSLGGVVVGEGPGSFTGVRVAAATAKGLAHALAVPLWAVSSLAAAALATDAGSVRYVMFDARSDRVYAACYGVGSATVQTLVRPHAGVLRDVLDSDVPAGAVFVGDAADRHRAVIEGAGYPVRTTGGTTSLAEGLIKYLTLRSDTAAVADIATWEPTYLRGSMAVPS